MEKTINIAYPEYLANTLKLNRKDFENEIKVSSLVKLFEIGKVSSGIAAKVLGLSRVDFLDMLARYKVSALGLTDDSNLIEDIENA